MTVISLPKKLATRQIVNVLLAQGVALKVVR